MRTRAYAGLRAILLAVPLAVLVLLGILLLSGPALAEEEAPLDAVDAVGELAVQVADADSTWIKRWRAYEDAKEALEQAEGETKTRAEEAYESIRPQVAAALRRERLDFSGWIMGFVGAVLLWGGFAFHVGIARRRGNENQS